MKNRVLALFVVAALAATALAAEQPKTTATVPEWASAAAGVWGSSNTCSAMGICGGGYEACCVGYDPIAVVAGCSEADFGPFVRFLPLSRVPGTTLAHPRLHASTRTRAHYR